MISGVKKRPGVPGLLRELNDRAAYDLLLAEGPLTRTRLGELTGLSKVTAAQLLVRLEERGLVEMVGEQTGARGPHAALYAIVPSAAYVGGLEVGPGGVTTAVADITGQIIAEETIDPHAGDDPVQTVHDGIARACRTAGIEPTSLRTVVVGTPGVIDPETGDLRFAFDLPEWHAGLRAALTEDLSCPVEIENDVNLAAVAEHTTGVGRGVDDFALVWAGRGVGLSMVIGGRLYRGRSGCAGEIGYLPVPGVPLATDVNRVPGKLPSVSGGLQTLVGEQAVSELARRHGLIGNGHSDWLQEAHRTGNDAFLDEMAERFALGVASVCVILDPGLVVLAGEVSESGGDKLAEKVEEVVGRICLVRPEVRVSTVEGRPVLQGAVSTAANHVRDYMFA